jgi:predicted N-acyltransferase
MTAALTFAKKTDISSLHILFPEEKSARELESQGFMLRKSVQFHWRRDGHNNFAEFLSTMKHEKRKKILKERKRLGELSITYEQIRGDAARPEDWDFFYQCYLHTHKVYQSPISLTFDFFLQIAQSMPKSLLLIFASRNGKRIAGAFNLFDAKKLYGRSWGALEYIPGLHFELCYYQAIDFCLANQIEVFEGGAQGEHKLARGFLPVTTWSAHWLAHPEFASAVDNFLEQEKSSISHYLEELEGSSPFKQK